MGDRRYGLWGYKVSMEGKGEGCKVEQLGTLLNQELLASAPVRAVNRSLRSPVPVSAEVGLLTP